MFFTWQLSVAINPTARRSRNRCLRAFVKLFTKPNDVVLGTVPWVRNYRCCRSASCGRKFLGIEIKSDYYQLALDNMSQIGDIRSGCILKHMHIEKLEREIARCLEHFYNSRLQGLEKLSLRKVLSKKNSYLYRALGIEKASEIVEQNLAAFVISSDETIFGNCSFEPLAKLASGGKVSDAEGVDFTVEFARSDTWLWPWRSGPELGQS